MKNINSLKYNEGIYCPTLKIFNKILALIKANNLICSERLKWEIYYSGTVVLPTASAIANIDQIDTAIKSIYPASDFIDNLYYQYKEFSHYNI